MKVNDLDYFGITIIIFIILIIFWLLTLKQENFYYALSTNLESEDYNISYLADLPNPGDNPGLFFLLNQDWDDSSGETYNLITHDLQKITFNIYNIDDISIDNLKEIIFRVYITDGENKINFRNVKQIGKGDPIPDGEMNEELKNITYIPTSGSKNNILYFKLLKKNENQDIYLTKNRNDANDGYKFMSAREQVDNNTKNGDSTFFMISYYTKSINDDFNILQGIISIKNMFSN